MNEVLATAFYGLAIMATMGFVTWLYTLYRNDVSIVDSLWSLMFLAAAGFYMMSTEITNEVHVLLFCMIALWSIRLSVFLTIRNWGQEEDRRYQEIRANNQPYFNYKSLYIVFGLQALLAWIISTPLLMAFSSEIPQGALAFFAVSLWLVGFIYESVADFQLYVFKSIPENSGKVLNTGLWAYSRHPNYFGECLIWWAYFMLALSSGAWWTVFSPVLMTLLLLKVSGVSLMEKDITERRANYAHYVKTTNAFIPGMPRVQSTDASGGN